MRKSREAWLRCLRQFLNINRGTGNHWVASVSVCRSAISFSHAAQKIIHRHARSHINSSPSSIPSSQFTLPFSCVITAEDCGTQMIEEKNRYWKSWYWLGCSQCKFQPQSTFKVAYRKLFPCPPPLFHTSLIIFALPFTYFVFVSLLTPTGVAHKYMPCFL